MPEPGSSKAYDRYSYVNNNPINNNDPSGHRPCDNFDGDGCYGGGSSSINIEEYSPYYYSIPISTETGSWLDEKLNYPDIGVEFIAKIPAVFFGPIEMGEITGTSAVTTYNGTFSVWGDEFEIDIIDDVLSTHFSYTSLAFEISTPKISLITSPNGEKHTQYLSYGFKVDIANGIVDGAVTTSSTYNDNFVDQGISHTNTTAYYSSTRLGEGVMWGLGTGAMIASPYLIPSLSPAIRQLLLQH